MIITTNRDKINRMSNSELAAFLTLIVGDNKCKVCCYTSGDCFGKSCVDGIETWLNGHDNTVKYISRAGRKNPDKTIEDLRKAVWYINRQIQILEKE